MAVRGGGGVAVRGGGGLAAREAGTAGGEADGGGAGGGGRVTLLRRSPRAVYRVYSEEEYLAGVDPFADLGVSPVREARRGPRLQRIAGAAALTGAVGTVGGVIGLAGLHTHSGDRLETAEHVVPERVVPFVGASAPARRAPTARARTRHVARPSPPRRGHAHSGLSQVALVPAHRIQTRPAVQAPARTIVASAPRGAPDARGEHRAEPARRAGRSGPRAQSELGFER